MVGSIPSPLFNSRTPIPPHTPITLNFLVDNNNYCINLINFAGGQSASTPLSIIPMNTIDNQTTADQIVVGVVDMFLYLYVENYDDIVNKTNEYTFLNYSGIMKTMQGSVNADNPIFSFPKERRYNFITCAFIQQQATIKNTLTDLGGSRFDQVLSVDVSPTAVTNSYNANNPLIPSQIGEIVNYGAVAGAIQMQEGYTKSSLHRTHPIINLRSISLLINGITFPSETYNFSFTINTAAPGTIYDDPPNDMYRAYQ